MISEREPETPSHLTRNQRDFLIRENYIAFTVLTEIEDWRNIEGGFLHTLHE